MDIMLKETEEGYDGITLVMKFFLPEVQKKQIVRKGLKEIARELEIDPDKKNLRQNIEKKMGEENAVRRLCAYVAQKAVQPVAKERGLDMMFAPEVVTGFIPDIYNPGNSEFKVEVIVRPQYELSSYDPVTVKEPSILVTEEMIDAQLKREMSRFASFEEYEGPISEGDFLHVNMKTFMNGHLDPTLSGRDMQVVLSRDMMPRGFVDNVAGMEIGGRKKFEFLASDTEHSSTFESVKFSVVIEILSRSRRVIPELTDEFVATRLSNTDKTVDQFKFRVRQFLMHQKHEEAAERREMLIDEEFSKRLTDAVPDKLIEKTRDAMYDNLRQTAASQGMNLVQFVQQQGMDEKQFQMNVTLNARESLRQGLALDALWRHYEFPILDEDRDKAIAELAHGDVETARRAFERNDSWSIVENMARRMKAHEWLVKTANIK